MKIFILAALMLLTALNGAGRQARTTRPGPSEAEIAAINRFYGAWSEALATRGAEGYVSFFAENGAVIPPDGPAFEGTSTIRGWIQKTLDEFTTRDARIAPGAMTVTEGMATWRFTITGERVPQKRRKSGSLQQQVSRCAAEATGRILEVSLSHVEQ